MIDRSGKHFGAILNFLRDGTVALPESLQELQELLAEAKFYLIEELVSECEQAIKKKQECDTPCCLVRLLSSPKEEKLLVRQTEKV